MTVGTSDGRTVDEIGQAVVGVDGAGGIESDMKRVRRPEEEEERKGRAWELGDWGVIFEWVPVLPSSQDGQDARKGAGGRWAQRDGVWIRGEGA